VPFEFTEDQRARLSTRLMVQPPSALVDVQSYGRWKAAVKRVNGLPVDVLMVLEALVMLAEQGNEVAAELYYDSCTEFGITFPRRFEMSG